MHIIIPTWESKNPSVLHHIEEWCYMGPRKYVNLEQTMIIKQTFIKNVMALFITKMSYIGKITQPI